MAIDTIKLDELDRIDKIKDRLDAADQKFNEIFATYNIPVDITDRDAKLSFVLAEIGDEQVARKEFRDKNTEAKKNFALASESISEDFMNMTELGNKKIQKYAEAIKAAEKDYEKQKLLEETKKNKIVEIDAEIAGVNASKTEIQIRITEAKSNSVKAKDEAKELTKKIAEAEAKITDIDTEIEKLNEANRNTNDPDELKNNAEKIASLQGQKTTLIQNRSELSTQHQDKETEKSGYEENIRSLKGDFLSLDSDVNDLSSQKNNLENELRLMPIVGEELRITKEEFEKKKEEYNKTVETMEKALTERGIDFKSRKPETPEKDNSKDNSKDKNTTVPGNGGGYGGGNGIVTPPPASNLPAVTPEQKKRKNLEYITGYADNGVVLPSDDRLKRIQSELGGRDYEAMVKAFQELKESPVKLTRDEKNKLKEMMKIDQKNIAQTVKDVDPAKLTKLFDSVGIQMTELGLKGIHFLSYERPSKNDENYGTKEYGILDGFSSMTAPNKSKWEEVVKAYTKNKANMSPEEIIEFERCVMTPLKFGTLQEQTKEVCKNRFEKLFSRGGNKQIADIRAAIAKAEVPEGEELSSTRKAKDFAESLKEMNEPNQSNNTREPKPKEPDERNI